MESKHDGLEDDVPFQTPVFQVSCFFFGGEGTPYSCFGRCDDDAYSAGDQQIPLWSSQRHLELAVFFRGGGDQIDVRRWQRDKQVVELQNI